MQAPATGFAPRKGALTFLAVILSATLVAAAPAVDVSQLQIVVWSDTGSMISDANVTAIDASGEWVKLEVMPDGTYLLPTVGPKSELEVMHPTLGAFVADLPLVLDGQALRIDVVYTGVDQAEAFSPNLLPPQPVSPADGTISNDLCANATAIGLGSVTGSTIGATFDNVGTCITSNTAPGVWYTVTGTGGTMTATTCGNAAFDTKISVFCGSCDALTCITGNDDNCAAGPSGLLSTASWCSQDGATYYILVHGFSAATGNFTLNVSSAGTCTGAVVCIVPDPTGACCFDDGSCDILSADDCDAAGGTYQGDDTGCFAAGDAQVTDSGTLNIPIPDGLGTGIPGAAASHTLNVPSATIGDVDIDLTINHTWTGDLIVTVEHNGTAVTIVDRPGAPLATFGCAEDNWNIILDDEAASSIEAQCSANLTGSYSPNNPLSAFDGMDAGGDWTISVTDNANADLGTLVSWSVHVSGAGAPTCEQPECHLVIGSGPGSDNLFASYHNFTTQVANVAASYPVLMEDIPEFVLPAVQTTGRIAAPTAGNPGMASFGASSTLTPEVSNSPAWMASGNFSVQVLMWNPQVFPYLPEQYTPGLHVYVMADGTVRTVPFGTSVGGLQVTHEIDVNSAGQKVIRFPFTIPGF